MPRVDEARGNVGGAVQYLRADGAAVQTPRHRLHLAQQRVEQRARIQDVHGNHMVGRQHCPVRRVVVTPVAKQPARKIEPVRLCRFSRTKLRTLLDDFPAMEKRLLESATNELVAAQEQMLLLKSEKLIALPGRTEVVLLDRARIEAVAEGNG
jgi:hypothetical protein